MKYFCFRLSMPNVGSYNGKWSGEKDLYARVLKFYKKDKVPECKSYSYPFGDGWVARIDVTEVDSKEAKRIQKVSQGFLGYDWMINSIIEHDKIIYFK